MSETTLDPKVQRKLLKNAVALAYGKVRAAEEIVTETITEATPAIKALVEKEGPGPHLFSEKDGKGGARKFWLTFRKVKDSDAYTIKRKDVSGDDDATAVDTDAAAPPS